MIRAIRRDLYQVHVETRQGAYLAIGPKMIQEAAEKVLYTINREILSGREKDWSNATMAKVPTA